MSSPKYIAKHLSVHYVDNLRHFSSSINIIARQFVTRSEKCFEYDFGRIICNCMIGAP